MTAQWIARSTILAVVASVAACATAYASTLTVAVDPPSAGTAPAPQAHTTSLAVGGLDSGPDGSPKSALVTLTESLPADFATTLGPFATCSSAKVVHGDNKPDCPDGSIVGTAAGAASVPALLFHTTSDRGYIYKLNDGAVRAWIHFSRPQQVGVVVGGTFAPGLPPFGPTITWDFGKLASGAEAGAEVRVSSAGFVWTQQAGSAAAPTTKPKQSRAQCNRRARRIKNKRKRRRALRLCAKAKPKHRAPSPTTYSALSSTGCTTGAWPFRAQASFSDGTAETADATVACGAP
jgi:hypothetical protein